MTLCSCQWESGCFHAKLGMNGFCLFIFSKCFSKESTRKKENSILDEHEEHWAPTQPLTDDLKTKFVLVVGKTSEMPEVLDPSFFLLAK